MKKILIVEDNPSLRESLKELTEAAGYCPELAENGQIALEILGTNYIPDLIISDIMMPLVDGYQLRNIISSKPNLANVPFIFLTAKAQLDDIRKGMNIGADDYLTKPFKAADLLAAIEIKLNKKYNLDKKIDIITKNFALYVPHELRTPLVSILGYTGLLLSEKDEINKDEIFYMVERIDNSAKRLHETIEKFILFTEINRSINDKNYLETLNQPASANAEKIISNTASEVGKKYDRIDDLKFSLKEADLEIPVILFSIALKQIIENAFKFSKLNQPITISSEIIDHNYVVSIRDEGIGIEQKDIEMIDAFVQFERDENQQIGNGLGLIITKKIIENFNGKIEISSIKNEFTEVKIFLPL